MVERRRFLEAGVGVVGAGIAGCVSLANDATPTPESPEPTEPPPTTTEPPPATPEPEAVTIAFIGDQGVKETSREVLGLIRREGADLVLHAGDFDYENDPVAWNEMLVSELGEEFPYLATIGGHDMPAWVGYEAVLRERADVDGLEVTGDPGLQATATFEDVTIVCSSVGFCQDEEDEAADFPDLCERILEYDHEAYMAEQFSASETTWRICSWHKPHDNLNPGDKGTDAPMSAYDTCREHGALVHTADEHAYGRTYPMESFADRSIAAESPPYQLEEGTTFNVLSGLGGQSFYDAGENASDPWWAATRSEGDDGSFGAFFATLRPDGTGTGYFKDIEGAVLDGPFEIESEL